MVTGAVGSAAVGVVSIVVVSVVVVVDPAWVGTVVVGTVRLTVGVTSVPSAWPEPPPQAASPRAAATAASTSANLDTFTAGGSGRGLCPTARSTESHQGAPAVTSSDADEPASGARHTSRTPLARHH